ncbi:DNAJ heat shock N-terminal domain-containing protein [Euphorbia peplus]|nr:DNAJ heat shock N-terminal domain-containing protein [Euphorbia peplus]
MHLNWHSYTRNTQHSYKLSKRDGVARLSTDQGRVGRGLEYLLVSGKRYLFFQVEVKKQSSCEVRVTNNTFQSVAFKWSKWKRKLLDDQIKLKEEQEAFKVELKAMREAAQWRRLQGISMEGDDELLAEIEVKVAPTRDEWMTTLPPERKPGGMPMHSRTFSKGPKEGRGVISAWTNTPVDRSQKAKMNYLEAYKEAIALASNEEEKKRSGAYAVLVDEYNKAKRSRTLVEKHQEEQRVKRSKKKSKKEKEEWSGKHPLKPLDRETDLVAGRKKNINLVKSYLNFMFQCLKLKCCSYFLHRIVFGL